MTDGATSGSAVISTLRPLKYAGDSRVGSDRRTIIAMTTMTMLCQTPAQKMRSCCRGDALSSWSVAMSTNAPGYRTRKKTPKPLT